MKAVEYVVKSSDGQWLCFDTWSGDACLFDDVRDATRAYNEDMALAMVYDVKGRWPGITFTVEVAP